MNKKVIISIVLTIILLVITYFGIFLYQNKKANKVNYSYLKSIDEKNFTEEIKRKYTLKRCNWSILNPEFYKTAGADGDALITFYKFKGILFNNLSEKNFRDHIIGFSRVKNSTFPQLLKMVKDDCYQFQKSNNWWNKESKEIMWNWSRAETEEEKEEREKRKKQYEKELEKYLKENNLTKEEYEKQQNELTSEEKKLQDEVLKEYGF